MSPIKYKNPRTKWELPTEVEPEETVCVTVQIPKDIAYIAAFWGAVYELTKPYAWADDDDHTAIPVGARMMQMYDSAREAYINNECGDMEIEFQQAGDCTLQVRINGGEWQDIFNAQVCADQAAKAAIDIALENGTIAPGGQPGPDGYLPVSTCETRTIQLDARQTYIWPNPVSSGFTVSTDLIEVTWSDGSLGQLGTWYCPSGDLFLVYVCADSSGHLDAGDPLPTANHMRLIAVVDGVYYDVYDDTFTVPDGVSDAQLMFIANDSTPDDNRGYIRFQATVCNYHLDCELFVSANMTRNLVTDNTWECEVVSPYPGGGTGQGAITLQKSDTTACPDCYTWHVVSTSGVTGDQYFYVAYADSTTYFGSGDQFAAQVEGREVRQVEVAQTTYWSAVIEIAPCP